jgi:hypothetical protein
MQHHLAMVIPVISTLLSLSLDKSPATARKAFALITGEFSLKLAKRRARILSKPLENEFFWPSAKQIFFTQSLEITKQLPESRRISLDFNLAR